MAEINLFRQNRLYQSIPNTNLLIIPLITVSLPISHLCVTGRIYTDHDRIHFRKGIKGPKLILAGYSYFKNNGSRDRTYWLCSRNRYGRCKARIITMNQTCQVLIKNQSHNHDPDPAEEIENLDILPVKDVLDSLYHYTPPSSGHKSGKIFKQ